MKIRFDNVNFNSNNGPNGFGVKLAKEFYRQGYEIVNSNPSIQLSFIQKVNEFNPCVLRLDNLYFNTDQDWKSLNEQIRLSYLSSQAVVVQSNYNKELIEKYFGKKENVNVVINGTNLQEIEVIPPLENEIVNRFENVWMCASQWRPHKRLSENIRYYLEHKKKNDCLLICGKNFLNHVSKKYLDLMKDENIFYLGELNWPQLISCMKKSKYFIHLALLDSCPNVVVDAKSCNCIAIVSSSGGTKEICNSEDIVLKDMIWDFKPFKLYEPPPLSFEIYSSSYNNTCLSIEDSAKKYIKIMKDLINE